MEKLKCTSCGAELEVEDNKEYAVCNHCGARYKLNKDLNVNIRMDDNIKEVLNTGLGTVRHFSKFMIVPIIMFIIVFILISFNIFRTFSSHGNFKEENDKTSFNITFSHENGTKSAFFLESTLDDIIESNKTHDRKVSLVYEGKETTDEKEIIDIKHSLSGTYEVSVNYDDKGYVNQIIVEKIK